MYPKSHPTMAGKQSPSRKNNSDAGSVTGGKRQQLTLLLVNKFRNKFHINVSAEAKLDTMVRNHVTRLLNGQGGSSSITERALQELDAKLTELVAQSRGGKIMTGELARKSQQDSSAHGSAGMRASNNAGNNGATAFDQRSNSPSYASKASQKQSSDHGAIRDPVESK